MSRRGQTNARTSSYSWRVPIRRRVERFRSSLAPDREDDRLARGSLDRPLSSDTSSVARRDTRKCIPSFLCSRARAPHCAATSGNNVLPPPLCGPFSFPLFYPLSLPFVFATVPLRYLPRLSFPVYPSPIFSSSFLPRTSLFSPSLAAHLIPLVSFSFPPPALRRPRGM